ncbi:MAG: hypothetical protein RL204_2195, partial [Bacteroidota bacterium]
LVELQIVVLAVVGSIPIDHPKSRQRKLSAFFYAPKNGFAGSI